MLLLSSKFVIFVGAGVSAAQVGRKLRAVRENPETASLLEFTLNFLVLLDEELLLLVQLLLNNLQFSLQIAKLLDQDITSLSDENLEVATNLVEHCHLTVYEQVIEGQYKLAGALEHFSAKSEAKIVQCGVFVEVFLLARQSLHVSWLELEQKYHEAVDLNLLYDLLELEEALTMESFEMAQVHVGAHVFDVLYLE